jgi:hypothetical protein
MPEGHQFVSEGQRPGIGHTQKPLRPERAQFVVNATQIFPLQSVIIFINIFFQGVALR